MQLPQLDTEYQREANHLEYKARIIAVCHRLYWEHQDLERFTGINGRTCRRWLGEDPRYAPNLALVEWLEALAKWFDDNPRP